MNFIKFIKPLYRAICFFLSFICILSFHGCNNSPENTGQPENPEQPQATVFVSWFDADGTLIEEKTISADAPPSQRKLPSDTNEWHYTGWTVSSSGNITVCTATRVSKTKVIWCDSDGTVIKEDFILDKENPPVQELPSFDEKWNYTEWKTEHTTDGITYTAQRTPNSTYFYGNVFQIVVKDKSGEPISAGSGFVFNLDGWFITNNHVMDEGYSAVAFFDIANDQEGTKHTTLNIIGGAYHDETKDIFIGKLENYQLISQHYKDITFTDNYVVGESCYSVGYPNSSVKLHINEGVVLEEYSDIYDKINGVYYVLSDAYIAPGSSGGILINSTFEIIGITSLGLYADSNKQNFISGGSIPTFAFKSLLNKYTDTDLKALPVLYGV